MIKKNRSTVIFLITAFLFAHTAFAASVKRDEFVLGIAPVMSPVALYKRFAPLRDYLSQEMKREVIIELNSSVEQLIERTDAGRYDMVLTGPNFALRAFDSGLYLPGVIPGKLTTAVLLVNSSSSIKTIEQLKGKVISTPRKRGALGIIAGAFFMAHGFTKEELPKIKYYSSHNAAFMAMHNGDVDAAFIAEFGYRHLLANGSSLSIVEIGRTKPFPGLSLIISKRLSDELREKVIISIVKLGQSDQGKMILKKIAFPPFRRYSVDEFESIRQYMNSENAGKKSYK